MKLKQHRLLLAGSIVCLLLIMTGCYNREANHHLEDVFNVSFISSVPTNRGEDIENYITRFLADDLPEGVSVRVNMFLPSHDRLTIEMIDRQADVVIVDEGLEQLMLDPYYLVPLDKYEARVVEDVTVYMAVDDRIDEQHVYLLPLRSQSLLLQELGYRLPYDLIIGVVESSPHQALGHKLVDQWLE